MLASGPTSVNDHAQASKKERQGWTAGWAGRTITCPRSNADPAREKQHEAFAINPGGQAITALGVHHPQGSNRRFTAPFGAMSSAQSRSSYGRPMGERDLSDHPSSYEGCSCRRLSPTSARADDARSLFR